MLKNKLDFKLVNLALLTLIFFLLYQTGGLLTDILAKIIAIAAPFFFAFVIAYAFNPILRWMVDHRIPKILGVIIILIAVLGVIGLVIGLGLPLVVDQLSSLFNGIVAFFGEISSKFDVNFGDLQQTLSKSFNDILTNVGKYVSDGAINVIGVSLSYLTSFMIALSAGVYLLIDMDKIRMHAKMYLMKKSNKAYLYIARLDNEMKRYLTGLIKIMFITIFEYSLAYLIIGHPNALLLGFLACIAVLIPYFGGIFVNIIAAITAFVISPALFVRTIITFVILSWLDGYLINPLVYGKTNRVHPLVVILAVFAGGILFGVGGIVLSLPMAIIISATFSFFRNDIAGLYDKKKRKRDLTK